MKTWSCSKPSNIALIKYMGKTDVSSNKPTNSSLSWTMNHLQTTVTLTVDEKDHWSEASDSKYKLKLSEKGQARYLKHLNFLKSEFGLQDYYFHVQSKNNFPSDCGLASSASSFAALTECVHQAALDLASPDVTVEQLASFSQQGSGSSCRSFFSPWGLWTPEGAQSIDLPVNNLKHVVVIVDEEQKKISSSEAHKLVAHSELFPGRPERAEKRLSLLCKAFEDNDWKEAFEICWREFWDMHVLFETCKPSFGYMNSGSLKALEAARQCWDTYQDGPLVTMDAGPNVHYLFREDQKDIKAKLLKELSDFKIIDQDDF
ncbi:MAG: diphosphomevalonate decarboxylase [Bdellovibrionales bacterium]|nr:diphosphomevalonate decarboxylase [Bdellovibrionales bacterium]